MDPTPNALLQFLGRLHPLVVHFPIALLLVAGVIEGWFAFVKREREASASATTCLAFGAFGAVAAALFGWLYADFDPPGRGVESELLWHRWVGVATAVVAVIAFIASRTMSGRSPGSVLRYRILLGGAALLVLFGSHLGGEMVYGEGYLWESFESQAPPADPGPPSTTDPDPAPTSGTEPIVVTPDPDPEPSDPEPEPEPDIEPIGTVADPTPADPVRTGVDYLTQIAPIFEARCGKCHGAKGRAKAGLRLHDMREVFTGDREYWVIQPGDAAASVLAQLVRLPADSDDIMPASGDPLTAEQIQLIVDWIDQGASSPEVPHPGTEAGGAPVAPPVEEAAPAAPEASNETASTDAPAPAPDRDAIARAIVEHGGFAGRVSLESNDFDVNLGLAVERTTDASLALLDGLEADLVALDLSRSKVTDAGVAKLKAFPRLARLRLDRTQIGDDALRTVGALEALVYLNLVGTAVTDAGLDALHGLANLRQLYLWQTSVTDEGVARLEAALPELDVER